MCVRIVWFHKIAPPGGHIGVSSLKLFFASWADGIKSMKSAHLFSTLCELSAPCFCKSLTASDRPVMTIPFFHFSHPRTNVAVKLSKPSWVKATLLSMQDWSPRQICAACFLTSPPSRLEPIQRPPCCSASHLGIGWLVWQLARLSRIAWRLAPRKKLLQCRRIAGFMCRLKCIV